MSDDGPDMEARDPQDLNSHVKVRYCPVKPKCGITAYFSSEQLLHFDFARFNTRIYTLTCLNGAFTKTSPVFKQCDLIMTGLIN